MIIIPPAHFAHSLKEKCDGNNSLRHLAGPATMRADHLINSKMVTVLRFLNGYIPAAESQERKFLCLFATLSLQNLNENVMRKFILFLLFLVLLIVI
jgi:hypothetical protein